MQRLVAIFAPHSRKLKSRGELYSPPGNSRRAYIYFCDIRAILHFHCNHRTLLQGWSKNDFCNFPILYIFHPDGEKKKKFMERGIHENFIKALTRACGSLLSRDWPLPFVHTLFIITTCTRIKRSLTATKQRMRVPFENLMSNYEARTFTHNYNHCCKFSPSIIYFDSCAYK